jgi:hypothetical protein
MMMYLICDESGAKGRAINTEAFVGEVGIAAGFLIDDGVLPTLLGELEQVCAPVRGIGGKLHVTDLPPQQQHALREGIFSRLRNNGIPCIYEAIHVQGFHEEYQRLLGMRQTATNARRSQIKLSANMDIPVLHEVLVFGLFTKAVAFLEDHELYQCQITVRTDRLDRSTIKAVVRAVDEFKEVEHSVTQYSGWDPVTKAKVKGQVEWNAMIPAEYEVKWLKAGTVTIEQDDTNDALTVAADVLANSLNYLFVQRTDQDRGKPLNRVESVQQHPLRSQFSLLWSNPDTEYFVDAVYQHPIEGARLEAGRLLKGVPDNRRGEVLLGLVRRRAHAIFQGPSRNPDAVGDWYQARRHLGIPDDLHV